MGVGKKWLFTLFTTAFLSILLLLYSIPAFSSPRILPSVVNHGPHYPPAFGYYLYGGRGDRDQIFRLLLAVYHPRNRYLLHLGADASDEDRYRLVAAVNSVPAIKSFGNVDVIGKPGRFSPTGSSYIAATLLAASILMKLDSGWDWFIALHAKDYPLITQDDLSQVFSTIKRDLNFMDHTSDIGWKEGQRFQPIIVDPAIYLARRTQIFTATEKRPTPDAFKIFTGSPWVVLSRPFLEFCLFGWDNLPRTLLMYFNNVILAEESYFQTVICNSPEFKSTTINSDLRYMIWDIPPKMDPHFLNVTDFDEMVKSGSAFARQFERDDPVLDLIDQKILKRGANRATPGAWCTGRKSWWMDPCSQWGDVNVLKAGPQAQRFELTITNLLNDLNLQLNQCK